MPFRHVLAISVVLPTASACLSRPPGDPTSQSHEGACDAGDGSACLQLAGQFKFGAEGKPRDPATATRYLERACTLGVDEGCIQLGYALAKGQGVPADPKRAFNLFNDACSRSHANGCDSLADAYTNGWGTAPDPARAKQARAKACSIDNEFCSTGQLDPRLAQFLDHTIDEPSTREQTKREFAAQGVSFEQLIESMFTRNVVLDNTPDNSHVLSQLGLFLEKERPELDPNLLARLEAFVATPQNQTMMRMMVLNTIKGVLSGKTP